MRLRTDTRHNRHTFVSLCREANAPLSVVEAIVGHSNPAMTRHYTHVSELAASQAVAALPALSFADGPVIPTQAKAALPSGPDSKSDRARLRTLVEKLTPANADEIRTELMALLGWLRTP